MFSSRLHVSDVHTEGIRNPRRLARAFGKANAAPVVKAAKEAPKNCRDNDPSRTAGNEPNDSTGYRHKPSMIGDEVQHRAETKLSQDRV
jgi:hypothetical protein